MINESDGQVMLVVLIGLAAVGGVVLYVGNWVYSKIRKKFKSK